MGVSVLLGGMSDLVPLADRKIEEIGLKSCFVFVQDWKDRMLLFGLILVFLLLGGIMFLTKGRLSCPIGDTKLQRKGISYTGEGGRFGN